MATASGMINLNAPAAATARPAPPSALVMPRAASWQRPRRMVGVRAAPEGLTGKVEESVKEAQEKCSEDPASGECAAAWDEVEELSAAASHARDRKKESSDPLETYCKDNPETDECRTYDN